MTKLHCVSCGKVHNSNNRYCEFCGYDLEDEILRFKQKQLPIKYENSKTSQKASEEGKQLQGMEFYQHIKKTEKRRRARENSKYALFDC